MTLEEKAEEWTRKTDNHLNEEKTHFLSETEYAERAYIAGAEENGVVWHDLRKDPNDLPKDCYDVLDEAGYRVFYHHKEGVWKNASGSKIVEVIAWCEIPQFKE